MLTRQERAQRVAEKLGLKIEGHTPWPWHYDTYNNIIAKGQHKFAPELVTICTIPDHPDSDSEGYTPEQGVERGWWYAESAQNADWIEAIPKLWNHLLGLDHGVESMENVRRKRGGR